MYKRDCVYSVMGTDNLLYNLAYVVEFLHHLADMDAPNNDIMQYNEMRMTIVGILDYRVDVIKGKDIGQLSAKMFLPDDDYQAWYDSE